MNYKLCDSANVVVFRSRTRGLYQKNNWSQIVNIFENTTQRTVYASHEYDAIQSLERYDRTHEVN